MPLVGDENAMLDVKYAVRNIRPAPGVAGLRLSIGANTAIPYGARSLDTVTSVRVVGLLAVVAALACLIPAWRATGVDPPLMLQA